MSSIVSVFRQNQRPAGTLAPPLGISELLGKSCLYKQRLTAHQTAQVSGIMPFLCVFRSGLFCNSAHHDRYFYRPYNYHRTRFLR